MFKGWFRKSRFFFLEKLVAPIALFPMSWLVRTWRIDTPGEKVFADALSQPRLMLVTYHGMMFHLLAFAHIAHRYGRQLVVMISPSRDGQLLGVALRHFGLDFVHGTTGSRAIGGAVELIRRVESGDIGVIAIDGPRGPCCVPKAGFLRLAALADAQLIVAATSAGSGFRLGSWDRAHLPLPLSRVRLRGRVMPAPIIGAEKRAIVEVQNALLGYARELASPVLPPALRQPAA